jgi:hypothetical protein
MRVASWGAKHSGRCSSEDSTAACNSSTSSKQQTAVTAGEGM